MIENNITTWILEYCYYLARKELRESQHIEHYISRDFIQGTMDQLETNEEVSIRSQCMVQILVLMCKFADGQDITVEYESDPKVTILEDASELLDGLMELEHSCDLVALKEQVKQQAVFVYARKEAFTKAEAIAKRLYGIRTSAGEKDFKRRVEDVLKAKDPAHPFLSQYSYETFLDTWFSILKDIETVLKINKPFLVEFAEKYADCRSSSDEGQQKSWEELDVDIRGQVLQQLVQHFCPQSVPLSARKQQTWTKRQRNIQKNQEEVLKGLGLMSEDSEGNKNANASSESEMELPPIRKRRKRTNNEPDAATPKKRTPPRNAPNKNTPKKHTPKKSTTKKNARTVDMDSDEEVYSDDAEAATPSSRISGRLASSKLNYTLAPKPPRPTPPRPTLNVERLSHQSVGGKAKRPWEEAEEEGLWEGVQQFGVGKWAQIKSFQELTQRSSVDIKDKWRNLLKDKHKYQSLEARLGPIPARCLKKK